MAKGLRSKSKRKNRTALREAICIPRIKKDQELLSQKLLESFNQKNGETIIGLKSVLSLAPSRVDAADLESRMEESDSKPIAPAPEKVKPSKGSKPRVNPGKTLAWFK